MDSAGSRGDSEVIRGALPQEVLDQIQDPATALLVTLYVLYMGRIVGEEMAGTVGFPGFPADRAIRRALAQDLKYYLDPRRAIDIITALEQSLHSPVPEVSIPGEAAMIEERLLLEAILTRDERTAAQGRALSRELSAIASGSGYDRQDLEYWEPGIKGIARITRLMIEAVPPTKVGTMNHLRHQGAGLRSIATLGGALFLGSSLRILADGNQEGLQPRYSQLGLRLAELTQHMGGQQVQMASSTETELYVDGLLKFARKGGSAFAIEHPFHFRVLLEVLSDENRRYPAEPVLNVEAMRRIWPGDSLWSNIVWSRDQLPVVVNLIRHPDNQRADAFIQHYAAFGRTPHTSSFTHLDYEIRSPVGEDPSSLSWPTAFLGYRDRPVQNMPNSVCEVMHSIEQQQQLGRIWRGVPEGNDLKWLCGQLVAWEEHRESDGTLAARIWRSSSWLGHALPVAAMAEIRTGAWILEALRLRLKATSSTDGGPDGTHPAQEQPDREQRAAQELRCVLEIMILFATDYISGNGDGITGLKKTLNLLKNEDWFVAMGVQLGSKLDYLGGSLDLFSNQLRDEVIAARHALESPDGHPAA